jgi:hypothetical protein
MVSPFTWTIQELVLSIFFPFLVSEKQLYPVIATNGSLAQVSIAEAVNEKGASGGLIEVGLSQEITGPTVSCTVIV